jgi:hypothetical protein
MFYGVPSELKVGGIVTRECREMISWFFNFTDNERKRFIFKAFQDFFMLFSI